MKNSRVKVIGLSLLLIIVIFAGWQVGIAPQLADASKANANRLNVMSQNTKNEAILRKLKDDYAHIDVVRKELSLLKIAVPSTAEISSFVTELNLLANNHKITVRSITVNDARPYTPIAPSTTAAPTGGVNVPTTNSRITPNNFIVIPVQFSLTGDYSSVLDFVHDVQIGSRLFLISNLSSMGATDAKAVAIRGNKSGPNVLQKVDATVGGYIYVLLSGSK